MRRYTLTAVVAAFALVFAAGAFAAPAGKQRNKQPVATVLAFNDFHGHLEATTPGRINDPVTGASVLAGGAEYFSTHMQALGSANEDTFVVSSGDMIGGSPLLSGLFHDEPTIDFMNHVGVDFNGVGNHEFDEGKDELLRMQHGNQEGGDGCHPVDGCQDGTPFAGSLFQFLAANVIDDSTGNPLLPPYEIKHVGGVKIAFIGETLEGTPEIVTPAGVEGLTFLDEADTVNMLVPRLQKRGVEAFVLLLHQGGFNNAPFARGFEDINACENFTGSELLDIVNRLHPAVDAVLSAHTHDPYICRQSGTTLVGQAAAPNGRLVTSASSFGRVITKIEFTLDKRSGDVVSSTAQNHVVTQTVDKDPVTTELLAHYKTFADPIANRVVGRITADLRSSRSPGGFTTPAGEQEMGNVIADAQREATRIEHHGGSRVAFMNPGGVRGHLLFSQISGGEQPGEVTYGEIFTVQPFANSLVVKTCTGAQLDALLEQQFRPTGNIVLLVSQGFTYTWDAAAPIGSRVDPSTIKIDGVTVDPATGYRVTMNSFLATGGDGFGVFNACTNPLGGEVDVDALGRYIGENSPVSPPALNRITRLN